MDRDQADMDFFDVTDTWLRDALSGEGDGLLAEMVLREPGQAVDLVNTILRHFRSRRELSVEAPADLVPLIDTFQKAAIHFSTFLINAEIQEPETANITRSEAHTSELHSLMRISYAVFRLKNNKIQ